MGHYTHEKSPLGAAAGLAAIHYIEKHNLLEHSRELGAYALERAKKLMDKHPIIGSVRGIGLFLGIELVKDRSTGERALDEAEAVMYRALSKGMSFKLTMGNILTLTPALTITKEEMDNAMDIIDECVTEVEK
ncbi:Isoleucine 2-epimerase [subsurface metagenome]